MKLFYTCMFVFCISTASFATTWNVAVSNFSFSPVTVNAVVGDIIKFNWVSGFHTTTCGSGLDGTTLPTGAAPWDATISSGSLTFSYTVNVPGNYFYGCTPHFFGGSGMVGNLIVSGTLPVALGNFNAAHNNKVVNLNWKTLAESNTSYFSVRRSSDGTKFTEIGRVSAAGNSSVALLYSFTDNNPGLKNKYLYYELVTVDKDQKQSFSEIKVVKNSLAADKLIMAISPNPVTRPGQMHVQFNADKNGSMQVNVFSSNGKLVIKERMAAFYGLNNAHLHVCDLQKGVYTIQFELDKMKATRRIVIQ